jgi:hypothetical protein
VPGRQFSASIGFLGAIHVANVERARLACTRIRSRTLVKARLIQTDDREKRRFAYCRIENTTTGPGGLNIVLPPVPNGCVGLSDRKVKTQIKQSGELLTGEYPNAEGGLVQHKVNERRVLAKTVVNKMVEAGGVGIFSGIENT